MKPRNSHYSRDPFSPTVANIISNTANALTTVYTFNQDRKKRYCEHCRSYQPTNDQPHKKGWSCNNCTKE